MQSSADVRNVHALVKAFPCFAAVQQDLGATPTQSLHPTLAPTHIWSTAHDASERSCACPPACMPSTCTKPAHSVPPSTCQWPSPHPHTCPRLAWCFSLTSSLRSGRVGAVLLVWAAVPCVAGFGGGARVGGFRGALVSLDFVLSGLEHSRNLAVHPRHVSSTWWHTPSSSTNNCFTKFAFRLKWF